MNKEHEHNCCCNHDHDHGHEECNCNHENGHCDCEHDHDHEHEHEEYETLHLTLDDDTELECDILGTFEVDDRSYIALLPKGDEHVLLYNYIEVGEEEIKRRLNWGLERFSTYVGINNHMGSKFTSDAASMKVVLAELKRRGLLFLDSRTSGKTVGAKLAERNIFLDHDNSIEAVNKQLQQVEKMARRTGLAIAIGHPREATIKALRPWLQGIEGKGFRLVPLSTVVSLTGGA